MKTLPFEYWHALASQLIVISSLMGGFSLSLLFVLEKNHESKISSILFKTTVISTSSFLISIFAFTKILLLTTPGFPGEPIDKVLNLPRIVGALTFLIGIISTLILIALSGWQKDRNAKTFTLIVGIVTLILILIMLN